MATKKKVEVPAVVDGTSEGTLIPSYNIDKAVGNIVVVTTRALPQIAEEFKALPTDLVAYAATIKGNAALKAFVKQCSSTRSALTAAHKEAKAPWLEATRKLDAALKAETEKVTELESKVQAALKAEADAVLKREQEAQAARLAELEAENAKLRQVLEKENVIPPMVNKEVVMVVRGRAISQAARSIFTDDIYDEVKTDENGVAYTLEVVLRRKEVQDV